jgi:hypothetical protein
MKSMRRATTFSHSDSISIRALEKVPLAELFAKLDTTKAMAYIPIQLEINGF